MLDYQFSGLPKQLPFINAQHGQQYRALVNNSSGCTSATATVVTITTNASACQSATCDKLAGTVSINTVGQASNPSLSHQVILTDITGTIQYVSAASSSSIPGVAGGDYLAYQVSFDNTQTPLPTLSIGTNLSAVGGACVKYSNQLALKVCAVPSLVVDPAIGPGPTTQPVTGTATPGTLIAITDPTGQTLCTTTASASGTFSCPVSLTSPVTTLTVTACNSAGCTTQPVTLTVNQPPTLTPDFADVIPGIPAKGNVLTNDRDPEGTPLTASLIGPPVPGLILSPDGSYTYTAPLGTTAPVTVPVQVCDGATPPACATSTLTLVPVPALVVGNNAPIANPDYSRTPSSKPLTVNVLANDRDPDGTPLTGPPVLISGPAHGTALVNPDGTVSYTPTAGYVGPDQLVYRVCDTGTPPLCSTATLDLTVDPTGPGSVTNTAPVAVDDALLTARNTSATATVAANDRDPEGQPLTYAKLTNPANGTVVFGPTGSYTYTPAPGFVGSDQFTYQVCDNASPALCTPATAHITVVSPATPPAYALNVKVLLQGALLGVSSGSLMRDDLRSGGYLPTTTPYSATVTPRFTQMGGGGGETSSPAIFQANAGTPDAIVDWVLVELRNSVDPSIVVATRSGLVQRDGDVVLPADGVSPLSFTGLVSNQYFVSVKHRNHLGTMTATAMPMSLSGTVVDFTTMTDALVYDKAGSVNYNGVEMVTVNGKRALWAGDANADGKVKYIGSAPDNARILYDVITFQGANPNPAYNYDFAFSYFYGDVNLNGKAKYQGSVNDPSVVFDNVVAIYPLNLLQLYNYDFFVEQLP